MLHRFDVSDVTELESQPFISRSAATVNYLIVHKSSIQYAMPSSILSIFYFLLLHCIHLPSPSRPLFLLMCEDNIPTCVIIVEGDPSHPYSSAWPYDAGKDIPSSQVYTTDSMWHRKTLKHGYSVRHSIPRIQHYTSRSS